MNLKQMSNLKLDISKNPASLKLAIDWLNEPFEEMVKGVGEVNRKALNTAAYIIKDKIQETFTNKMPAAGRPFKVPATSKGGYKITRPDKLVDAVRQSSANDYHATVFMGGRDPGSPLFIARMYEHDTKDRYTKTYAKKKLKNRRFVGHLTGVNYFETGIQLGQQEAANAVGRIFEHYTEECMNNNN